MHLPKAIVIFSDRVPVPCQPCTLAFVQLLQLWGSCDPWPPCAWVSVMICPMLFPGQKNSYKGVWRRVCQIVTFSVECFKAFTFLIRFVVRICNYRFGKVGRPRGASHTVCTSSVASSRFGGSIDRDRVQLASRLRLERSCCESMQLWEGCLAKRIQFIERCCARDGGSYIVFVWLHSCRPSVSLCFGECSGHVRVSIHSVFEGFRRYRASLGSSQSVNEELHGSPRCSN